MVFLTKRRLYNHRTTQKHKPFLFQCQKAPSLPYQSLPSKPVLLTTKMPQNTPKITEHLSCNKFICRKFETHHLTYKSFASSDKEGQQSTNLSKIEVRRFSITVLQPIPLINNKRSVEADQIHTTITYKGKSVLPANPELPVFRSPLNVAQVKRCQKRRE